MINESRIGGGSVKREGIPGRGSWADAMVSGCCLLCEARDVAEGLESALFGDRLGVFCFLKGSRTLRC